MSDATEKDTNPARPSVLKFISTHLTTDETKCYPLKVGSWIKKNWFEVSIIFKPITNIGLLFESLFWSIFEKESLT